MDEVSWKKLEGEAISMIYMKDGLSCLALFSNMLSR
jgi:hypothetical protein